MPEKVCRNSGTARRHFLDIQDLRRGASPPPPLTINGELAENFIRIIGYICGDRLLIQSTYIPKHELV